MAYGGLHWSPDAIYALTPEQRRWYVERLQQQLELEQKQAEAT